MLENKLHKKRGFTLADILITIGIIGVVAALTLPNLMQNYRKQETVNKLKNFYSTLAQAHRSAINDFGEIDYWDLFREEIKDDDQRLEKIVNTYFKPYMKIQKFNYTPRIQGSQKQMYQTSDGSCFNVINNSGQIFYIIVDLNCNAKPNKRGHDVFDLDIYRDIGLYFLGAYSPDSSGVYHANSRDSIKNGLKINNNTATSCCNKTGCGVYSNYNCGALIFKDGWKISDDYPW